MSETERAPHVFVDDRWAGAHGIGRYATEVLNRLTVPFEPMRLPGSPSGPRELLRPVPAGPHDLVYSPGYNTTLRARSQFVTVHDLIHLHVGGAAAVKYRAYYAVARLLIRRSGLVFTVSDASAREIRDWLRDDDVTVVNTRGGCSAAFSPGGDVDSHDEPYVLFVGNLRAHKNVETFLGALARITGSGIAVVPAAERDDLIARAARHGVAERLIVRSGIDDLELARLYRGADALVFPSLREGFGLPALESVRCGTPVIHWKGCPSVAEIVGADGVAVDDATDAAEWAAAISALRDAPLAVSGERAAEFTWDLTAATVDAALRSRLAPS